MKRNLGAKITIWIVLILMSMALIVPSVTGIIQSFIYNSSSNTTSLDSSHISVTTEVASSEAERKNIQAIQSQIEESSSEAEKSAYTIPDLEEEKEILLKKGEEEGEEEKPNE